MRRALISVPAVALSAIVLTVASPSSSAQSATIDVGNVYFCNASFQNGICETTVQAGSTVTWSVSSGFHTVTQCDASFTGCPPTGGFDSGQLSTGATFSQTFNDPGTIPYYCAFHPTQMRGRILVQAQSTATPAPTATPAATSPGSGTPAPTSTGAAGATSSPAQVPSSGGSAGASGLSDLVLVGAGLLVAGFTTLAWTRIRRRRDEI